MKKILVIEDEDMIYFRPIAKLKEKYDVRHAISIKAAIKIIQEREEEFDLVILDIMMGWGPYSELETDEGLETGWVFYKKILENLKLKVIVWTRNSDIFEKSWGSNVVALLTKTHDDYQLVDAANKHIGE